MVNKSLVGAFYNACFGSVGLLEAETTHMQNPGTWQTGMLP